MVCQFVGASDADDAVVLQAREEALLVCVGQEGVELLDEGIEGGELVDICLVDLVEVLDVLQKGF